MKKIFLIFMTMFTFLFGAIDSFASGINSTLAKSAPCDNDTLETYSGTANVEIDWRPNTIDLTWYNGDTQISGPTTCTYDGALSVPSTPPTKTGYTFVGWEIRGLPTGYTKLEYLQFNGAQWIDTGITPNQDSRARITAMSTSTAAGARSIGGSYGGTGWGHKTFGCYGGQTTGYIFFNYYSDTPINYSGSQVVMNVNQKYVFEINKNNFYLNEVLVKSASATTFTALESFRIGMLHLSTWQGEGSDRFLIGRIYDFAMWNNGTLVREMIPAKRDSDNVLGMYDTVTQTFFTNAGTGAFVAGPAVQ